MVTISTVLSVLLRKVQLQSTMHTIKGRTGLLRLLLGLLANGGKREGWAPFPSPSFTLLSPALSSLLWTVALAEQHPAAGTGTGTPGPLLWQAAPSSLSGRSQKEREACHVEQKRDPDSQDLRAFLRERHRKQPQKCQSQIYRKNVVAAVAVR